MKFFEPDDGGVADYIFCGGCFGHRNFGIFQPPDFALRTLEMTDREIAGLGSCHVFGVWRFGSSGVSGGGIIRSRVPREKCLSISVKSEVNSFRRQSDSVARGQLRFAVAMALNEVGRAAIEAERAAMRSTLVLGKIDNAGRVGRAAVLANSRARSRSSHARSRCRCAASCGGMLNRPSQTGPAPVRGEN